MKAPAIASSLHYDPIPLDEVRAAQSRTAGIVTRTPLVRFDGDAGSPELYLKLEALQPIRSFKLRGASNAMLKAGRDALSAGVWTSSAGNMAQGVAWSARELGIPASVFVPNTAPRTKIDAVRRYGGTIVELSVEDWFEIFRTRHRDGASGVFIHPYSDPDVMAGNAVIGLEIVEDLPAVDAVIVPWGGGGLCCGIASVIKALRPETKVFASEIETGAPLAPSLAAGAPVDVQYTTTFVDGIGSPFVNQEMFDLARRVIDGAIVVSLAETADAMRAVIDRTRVVPEGAAATSVAAAMTGKAGTGKIVCVVSGGNIDAKRMITALEGGIPA